MTIFVDTSALIALLDEDDVHHSDAAGQFRALVTDRSLVTHNYVEVETVALVRRRLGIAAVQRLTDSIFPVIKTIWVDETTHASALAVHRLGGGPSLVDHVSFLVMRQHGLQTAFAYDADFDVQGFAALPPPTVRPAPRSVNEEMAPYGSTSPLSLVSVSEIAARAGRSTNTVQSWRRRNSDFPPPVVQLATGPVWNWPAVSEWIFRRGKASAGRVQDAADRSEIRRLISLNDQAREAYFLASNRNMLQMFTNARSPN